VNPVAERMVAKYLKDMLKNVTDVVELVGFVNPMNKVYALSKPLEQMPLVFTLLTICSFDLMTFSAHTSSLL
jgi:uncharacterized membrane protein